MTILWGTTGCIEFQSDIRKGKFGRLALGVIIGVEPNLVAQAVYTIETKVNRQILLIV